MLIKVFKDGEYSDSSNCKHYKLDVNGNKYELACDKSTNIVMVKPTPTPQVSLKLDKSTASVKCGDSLTLKATVTGSSSKVSWKSSDTGIAAVDSAGKITAKQAGTVTITATVAGKSASCVVTVLYKDVTNSKDFWYAPTNYLTAAGVVKGYDKQTKFKPANECSRAQMVTFLWRLNGSPNPKSKTTTFKDIETSDYYYKPVLWAVEKGITTGVTKEKFNPKGICTRAQTVTFLWRMANKPEPKAKTSKFTDIKAKDYFYKAAIWASEKKILAGYADNTFRPDGHCLRRQMVTFLYKYDKYINGKG
ncbi:MAG: S-layer homology domain-containing protein [Saccharofermentans sp.]|nr:S-layer homology domain-containing protein [Saccharofermentans sp.]